MVAWRLLLSLYVSWRVGPGEQAVAGTLARRAWIELVERVAAEELKERVPAAWKALEEGVEPLDLEGGNKAGNQEGSVSSAPSLRIQDTKNQGFLLRPSESEAPSLEQLGRYQVELNKPKLAQAAGGPGYEPVRAAELNGTASYSIGERPLKRIDMDIFRVSGGSWSMGLFMAGW